jgi:hypothetical protein
MINIKLLQILLWISLMEKKFFTNNNFAKGYELPELDTEINIQRLGALLLPLPQFAPSLLLATVGGHRWAKPGVLRCGGIPSLLVAWQLWCSRAGCE